MATNNLITTLQNGARARLRSISLPYSKASVGIANVLLSHGFVHNVTRGTREGPSPLEFNTSSPGMRRLWVDIKYGTDDRAVMGHARVVSKPSRRVFLDTSELLRLSTGRRAQFVNPLRLGEIAIVKCIVPVSNATEAGTSSTGSEASAQVHKDVQTRQSDSADGDIDPSSAHVPARPGLHYAEQWLEARQAIGLGLSGEIIARVG